MKKVRILLMMILAMVLSLNSCGDVEKVGDVNAVTKDGTLKVDFDGETFVSTTVQAIVNDKFISITGLRAPNGDFFQITLPTNKIGTYTWKNVIDYGGDLGLRYTPASGTNAFVCVPQEEVDASLDYTDIGTLTISSIDTAAKKISGTFQFSGVDASGNKGKGKTKLFTKGVFTNIAFTSDAVQDQTQTSNTFSVKLDQEAFVPTSISAVLQNDRIAIAARRGTVETIELFLPSTVKEGTYDVKEFGMDFTFLYNKNMTAENVFSGTGSITITSHDTSKKIIKGKFNSKYISLLVKEEHSATEGDFSVSY